MGYGGYDYETIKIVNLNVTDGMTGLNLNYSIGINPLISYL